MHPLMSLEEKLSRDFTPEDQEELVKILIDWLIESYRRKFGCHVMGVISKGNLHIVLELPSQPDKSFLQEFGGMACFLCGDQPLFLFHAEMVRWVDNNQYSAEQLARMPYSVLRLIAGKMLSAVALNIDDMACQRAFAEIEKEEVLEPEFKSLDHNEDEILLLLLEGFNSAKDFLSTTIPIYGSDKDIKLPPGVGGQG